MTTVRIAAAGDIHCGPCENLAAVVADTARRVDAFLLAGDLTTHGEPEQAQVVADAFRGCGVPVLAVLGNHDWHADRRDDFVAVLEAAGIRVIDPGHAILDLAGIQVGVAGVKGFVGGFPGSHLPDFGEPLLRQVYAASIADQQALDIALQAIRVCPIRIVLLHYAPCTQTLIGEPEPIWAFLGTDRLAPPIVEHEPDLVLHGHAHAGTFEGRINDIPVLNVSVPVMRRDFHEVELTVPEGTPPPLH